MPQEHGHLANTVKSALAFTCLICGASPTYWTWSDYHGEAMCTQCGVPYQLLQRDEDDKLLDLPPRINLKEEWIPIFKQYWRETGQFTGVGTILIARDYPECIEGQRRFHEWLDRHPELVPGKES